MRPGMAWQLQGNARHSYLKSILKCAFGAQFACKCRSCCCGFFVARISCICLCHKFAIKCAKKSDARNRRQINKSNCRDTLPAASLAGAKKLWS